MAALVPSFESSDFESAVRNAFNTVRLFSAGAISGWETAWKIPLSTFQAAQTATKARQLLEIEILKFLAENGTNSDWFLAIPPIGSEGFAISVGKSGNLFRVLFGELEEEFETLSEALTWISRALSDSYQLRITLIGGRRREWTLEPVVPNAQNPVLAGGHLVPFRRLRAISSVVYRNSFSESCSTIV